MTVVEIAMAGTARPAPDAVRDGGAVSWAAVFAGAAGAAALSLILLVLGTGLGLASISPWTRNAGATAITWPMILWLAFTALAASALGGYLAGRLRTRWPTTHPDEVYFRDTAHGFLAWAVATLVTAATLTATAGVILGAGAATVAATAERDGGSAPMYSVDSLFRLPAVRTEEVYIVAPENMRSEVARIFANGISEGGLSPEDSRYTAQLVSRSTGLSQPEAEARVTATYEATARAVDNARKNAALASLWVFVTLLLGAFSASLAATIGGRRRDLI